MSLRRVVITGLGTVNPIGNDVRTYWHNLLAGASGVGPITLFDTSAFKVHFGGEVKDFQAEPVLTSKEARRMEGADRRQHGHVEAFPICTESQAAPVVRRKAEERPADQSARGEPFPKPVEHAAERVGSGDLVPARHPGDQAH
jgi:hypothetical protein